MINSKQNKKNARTVLTARDKAIELLADALDLVELAYTETEVFAAMTERERQEVENQIKELRKNCKERCLKSRTRKKGG